MDTIRTVYIDSQHSTERNGSYVLDLQGGIAVPEGARVFVDNASFTNTFSEEVTLDNQFLYLQTFESTQVEDFTDQSFIFGIDGDPKKDLLHSVEVVAMQPVFKANLSLTHWTDGTNSYIFRLDDTDQFEFDVNGVAHKIFLFDVTPDSMSFHAEWPTPGALASGVLNGHTIHLGAQTLTAQNPNADLLFTREKQPVLNLEGTWTSPGKNPMVLQNRETPFEYRLDIPQVNFGDPVISGFIKVEDVLTAQTKRSTKQLNKRFSCA